jgi:ketosteroid isomerase-like protein
MSENIETARRLMELFTGGRDAAAQVFDLFDPEIEIHDHPRFPDAEWHYGHEGVAAFAVKFWTVLGPVTGAMTEFVEAPDGMLVVRGETSGIGKGSGVPWSETVYVVLSFREGKILRFRPYSTRAEALAAVGLNA